jgi:hypothetical protein
MKKTLLRALSVCAICLILSGCYHWTWKGNPYVGDSAKGGIVNADGIEVQCTDPLINDFTCLSSEDIATLKIEIEKVKKYCGKK